MAYRPWIVALIVGAAGLAAHAVARGATATAPRTAPLHRLPDTVGDWSGQDYAISDNEARVLAADATLHRRYRHRDGTEVWLFIAYFGSQSVNSQIHSPRNCMPGHGWNIVSIQKDRIPLPGGAQDAARMLIQKEGKREEMLYWFRTRAGVLTGEYALKWDLTKSALGRRPTDAAFVRYTAPLAAAAPMRELVAALDGPLDELLAGVGFD
jgi:EpsI family protein